MTEGEKKKDRKTNYSNRQKRAAGAYATQEKKLDSFQIFAERKEKKREEEGVFKLT